MKIKTAFLTLALISALCISSCGAVEDEKPEQTSTKAAAADSSQTDESSSQADESSQTDDSSQNDESTAFEDSSAAAESTADSDSSLEAESSDNSTDSSPADTSDSESEKSEGFAIKPGVWLAVSYSEEDSVSDRTDRFYEINADGTGICVYQQTGNAEDLTYETDNTPSVIFSYPDDTKLKADITTVSDDEMVLDFGFDLVMSWRYITDGRLAEYEFYTTSQLEDMAKEFFNASDGRGCESTRAYINDDDMIVIELFEGDSDEEPINIYTIDRTTADGRDWDNVYIDLTELPRW